MHSWTVTATMKTMNEDNDKDTNCEDNDDLIFDTTTNLWLDASWQGGGVISGDFDDNDDGNNDGSGEG